jgi:uncharacterized protein YdaU (DUF1376 family)
MASPLPYMQFYVKEWLASSSVTRMPLEAQGAYIRLLCYQWEEGSIPEAKEEVRLMLAASLKQIDAIWGHLCRVFPVSGDGERRNPRCERDREDAFAQMERNRENGRRGGRPAKPKPNPNETETITQTKGGVISGLTQTKPKPNPDERHPEPEPDISSSLRSELRENAPENRKPPVPIFRPPTQAEVHAVMATNHGLSDSDAETQSALFWNHYDAFGWRVSGNAVVNWQSLVGKWITQSKTGRFKTDSKPPSRTPARQETATETLARRKKEMGYSG